MGTYALLFPDRSLQDLDDPLLAKGYKQRCGKHWLDQVGSGPSGRLKGDRMATAGTVMFELKIAVEVVQAEDGRFYVDAATTESGVVHEWTEGPFDTEAKARESLRWHIAMPVIEKL